MKEDKQRVFVTEEDTRNERETDDPLKVAAERRRLLIGDVTS